MKNLKILSIALAISILTSTVFCSIVQKQAEPSDPNLYGNFELYNDSDKPVYVYLADETGNLYPVETTKEKIIYPKGFWAAKIIDLYNKVGMKPVCYVIALYKSKLNEKEINEGHATEAKNLGMIKINFKKNEGNRNLYFEITKPSFMKKILDNPIAVISTQAFKTENRGLFTDIVPEMYWKYPKSKGLKKPIVGNPDWRDTLDMTTDGIRWFRSKFKTFPPK